MVPTQWNSQVSLLLLLGILGMMILVHAPPPGITGFQWFEIQHTNRTSNHCNLAMQAINRYNYFPGGCKGQNTFLNTTRSAVISVCHGGNITCSDGVRKNCHSSGSPVGIIYCNLTRRAQNYTQCQYQQTNGTMNYDVACNRNYEPVHLDRIY